MNPNHATITMGWCYTLTALQYHWTCYCKENELGIAIDISIYQGITNSPCKNFDRQLKRLNLSSFTSCKTILIWSTYLPSCISHNNPCNFVGISILFEDELLIIYWTNIYTSLFMSWFKRIILFLHLCE